MTPSQSAPKPRSQSRQRPIVASARLSDPEWKQLRAAAERDGRSVSDYLRGLVLRDLTPA
jgi:hypothetical protein